MTSLRTGGIDPRMKAPKHQNITDRLMTSEQAVLKMSLRREKLLEQIRELSVQVVSNDIEMRHLAASLKWQPQPEPAPTAVSEQEPGAELEVEVSGSGRPIIGVISTSQWLRLLEGGYENIAQVAHYYGRSRTGMARMRLRAMHGELPESKNRGLFFTMVLNGETPEHMAGVMNRPVAWVKNYQNLMSAYASRKQAGLPIPENIDVLLSQPNPA